MSGVPPLLVLTDHLLEGWTTVALSPPPLAAPWHQAVGWQSCLCLRRRGESSVGTLETFLRQPCR